MPNARHQLQKLKYDIFTIFIFICSWSLAKVLGRLAVVNALAVIDGMALEAYWS
jgi:hypothetical protein